MFSSLPDPLPISNNQSTSVVSMSEIVTLAYGYPDTQIAGLIIMVEVYAEFTECEHADYSQFNDPLPFLMYTKRYTKFRTILDQHMLCIDILLSVPM